MRGRLVIWLVACAASAVLVLLAVSRTWASFAWSPPLEVTGGEAAPALNAVALAALAGCVAVVATRGAARRVMGALIALCGAIVAAGALSARTAATMLDVAQSRSPLPVLRGLRGIAEFTFWPYAAVIGGVLLIGCGLWAAILGGSWPGMSGRYERGAPRPVKTGPPTDRELWDALDTGDDPTRDP